ncbi:hypothetical protein [Glaciecola sp. 1036]|uniref:hypothetical protein n=1 Tax=Alteromonadaceae TaxID=72275 RepID=UPI003D017542
MPFTPFHMGPGILIKALLQGSFSLMVFGWSQIVMDLQPLWVLITGQGYLHGFSHTFVGSTLLAIFSAITGKYLSEIGLRLIGISKPNQLIKITWTVAFLSAFIGGYSHVVLDAIMHSDLRPYYPLNQNNQLLEILSISQLHKLCLYTGLFGALLFFVIQWKYKK